MSENRQLRREQSPAPVVHRYARRLAGDREADGNLMVGLFAELTAVLVGDADRVLSLPG